MYQTESLDSRLKDNNPVITGEIELNQGLKCSYISSILCGKKSVNEINMLRII